MKNEAEQPTLDSEKKVGAITKRQEGELPVVFSDWKKRVSTSLDLQSPRGRQLWSQAQREIRYNNDNVGNTTLNVTDYYAHDWEMQDPETGESMMLVRLVLFTVDGETYAATGRYLVESFLEVCAVFGYPPWDPPQALEVIGVRTKGGRKVFKLVSAVPAVNAKKGGK